MEKKEMMMLFKEMADYFRRREDEVGKALSGEKIYFLDDGYGILDKMVYELYDLDESEWNDDLIYQYLFGNKSLEDFERFAVKKGGSYDGLYGLNDRVWRELTVVKGGASE